MVSKEDITVMVKIIKRRRHLNHNIMEVKPRRMRFLKSLFNNYCKLNKRDGKENMLMFEICVSGAAKCWYVSLLDIIKKDFENLTEPFNHDFL